MKKMSTVPRIIIAIGSLAMCIMFFVPAWSIYLIAPQYPEGLSMQIWLSKITGQVEIINGLNHYIGMKHINADMFPEFSFLVYILGFFVLFGLVVAFTGSRKLLFAYLILSVLGAAAALFVDKLTHTGKLSRRKQERISVPHIVALHADEFREMNSTKKIQSHAIFWLIEGKCRRSRRDRGASIGGQGGNPH